MAARKVLPGRHVLEAVEALKRELKARFPVDRVILFGSQARGEARADSDIDVLVLTQRPVSHRERRQMVDIAFGVNMRYDSLISLLVVDTEDWSRGLWSLLPIRREVDRDGIEV